MQGSISWLYALRAVAYSRKHPDPFDRMLIGQAALKGVAVVSHVGRLRDTGKSKSDAHSRMW